MGIMSIYQQINNLPAPMKQSSLNASTSSGRSMNVHETQAWGLIDPVDVSPVICRLEPYPRKVSICVQHVEVYDYTIQQSLRVHHHIWHHDVISITEYWFGSFWKATSQAIRELLLLTTEWTV